MKIRTTVVCLPVSNVNKTLTFYRDAFGFSEAHVDEEIVALELPNLSLFLMDTAAFESYTKKVGRGSQFPNSDTGMIISCAIETKEEVDTILENAPKHGGTVPINAAMDEASGGYIGYVLDPDGHLWELVYPKQ